MILTAQQFILSIFYNEYIVKFWRAKSCIKYVTVDADIFSAMEMILTQRCHKMTL